MLDLPKYMNDVLHFSISDNGFYSSLPQLMKLIMALLTGALNDWLIIANYLTITNGRKLFVAIGMYTFLFNSLLIHSQLHTKSPEMDEKSGAIQRDICYVC